MPFDDEKYARDTVDRARLAAARKRRRVRKKTEPPKPGDRSGMLTVVSYNSISHYCECRCDCGKTSFVEARYIKQRLTRSCGCQRSKAG